MRDFAANAAWQYGPVLGLVVLWSVLPNRWQRALRPWISRGGAALFGLIGGLAAGIGVGALIEDRDLLGGAAMVALGAFIGGFTVLFFRGTAHMRVK